jgi:heme/copper-type cytochrome/quinol oxidase subunit 2
MNTIIWICATAAIVIFGVMLHSVATFRTAATPLRRHALVEVAWALVPILIVIAAAFPSLKVSGESSVVAIAATE